MSARVAAAMVLLAASPALAREEAPALPEAAQQVDVDEQLGRRVDMDAPFTDQDGRAQRLRDAVSGRRPILLVLAYYRCPMLCGLVLRGVVEGVNQLQLSLGSDFDAVTVSVDPRDTPESARQKRASVIGALGGADTAAWPFLVGRQEAIARLADEVGFRYAYDARADQYAHPAVTIVLTPDGRVSRYLHGVSPSARDLRLSLVEAGAGRTGGIVDRVIMTCYRYDPASRTYAPYVLGFVRAGGGLVALTVAGTMAVLFRRERRRRA